MKKLWRVALTLCFVTAGTAEAQGTIYNNGAACCGLDGFLLGSTAANFTLGVDNATMTGATIETFAWQQQWTAPTAFDWTIFSNGAGNLPGTVFASGSSTPIGPGGNTTVQSWTFAVDPVTLYAGNTYWLYINPVGGVGNLSWRSTPFSNDTIGDVYNPSSWTRMPAPTGFGELSDQSAFTITGTTAPEPSSFALLGTGLLAVVPFARTRRRRQYASSH